MQYNFYGHRNLFETGRAFRIEIIRVIGMEENYNPIE